MTASADVEGKRSSKRAQIEALFAAHNPAKLSEV
eukprot:SAG11_NODE_14689_length_603_cov_0.821429_1_plen_33_part_01